MNQNVEGAYELHRQGARMAVASGAVAAVGLMTGTALYLLDELDVIADPPRYKSGGEDAEAELAANMVRYLERQHDVWWNIAVRDSLLPLAFLALIVLVVLAADRVRWRHPASVTVVCFVVGGVLNIASNLAYLGQLRYWRHTGWSADPPGPVIAVGTASDAVVAATTYVEAASYLVLATGAVCLGALTRRDREMPRWLSPFLYAQALGLLLLTAGIAFDADAMFQAAGAITGIVLGPVFAWSLGRHLARTGSVQS
jgi:hypothetical protein